MSYRRSIFLINKGFQLRFAFYVCSWLFALSLIYPFIIHSLYEYFIRYMSIDPRGPSLVALQEVRKQMMWLLILLQGLFLAITFIISVFLSHRIAGPIYKLRKHIEMAKRGIFEVVRFREKDHFKELAEDFNDLSAAIKSSQKDTQSAATHHIERALEKLAGNAGNAEVQKELEQALNTLRVKEH